MSEAAAAAEARLRVRAARLRMPFGLAAALCAARRERGSEWAGFARLRRFVGVRAEEEVVVPRVVGRARGRVGA